MLRCVTSLKTAAKETSVRRDNENARNLTSLVQFLINIHLFQKMSGRTMDVNCRTAIARQKRNVDVEY